MFREDNDTIFMNRYYDSGAETRLSIILDHYSSMPGFILTLQHQTIYNMDADIDNMNSTINEGLGVRVQTSGIGDSTESKGIRLAEVEKAFETGELDSRILLGIEDAEDYKFEIWVIYLMKKDFALVDDVIKHLKGSDSDFFNTYLNRRGELKMIADEYGMEYEAARKRVAKIRKQIKNSTLRSIDKRCKR